MKLRKLLLGLLFMFAGAGMLHAALITSTGTKPSVGNGNKNSPYEIRTAEELRWFVYYENTRHWFPDDYAKLMADIDLSSVCGPDKGSWIPLGHVEESGAVGVWLGKLYGNNHTISGLYIDGDDMGVGTFMGFCGSLNSNATIADLTLKGEIINAQGYTGSLAGVIAGGSISISNCVSEVNITISKVNLSAYIGGLIGFIGDYQSGGSISRCTYKGNLSNHCYCSGSLIGWHGGAAAINGCSAYTAGERAMIGVSCNAHTISNCISDNYIIASYRGNNYQKDYAILRNNIFVGDEYQFITDATYDSEGSSAVQTSDIASGAACYLMNQKMGGQYFTQTIGTDMIPIAGNCSATVYKIKRYTKCGTDNWEWAYSNTDKDDTTLREHLFDAEHPYCTRCGDAVNPDYGISKDSDGYYLAGNANDIKWLWNLVNVSCVTDAKIRLTADIDMNNEPMEPLALFSGILDGQGHTLSNINIACTGITRVGLVGNLHGSIRDLVLSGTVEGTYASYLGAFAGYVWDGASIRGVRNDCTVKATGTIGGDIRTYIGGIAGISEGSLSYCINNGPVVDASVCTGSLTRHIAGVAGRTVPRGTDNHLANNGVVGATGSADTDYGAAVVNILDVAKCTDTYYTTGISNPGLEYFFSNTPGTTDRQVLPTEVGSGKLAWLLSGKDYDADDTATRFFGQTIGTDMVPYPFVNDAHKGVYNTRHYYTCDRYSDYSNSPTDEAPGAHSWNDSHYCNVCYTIDPEYMTQDDETKAYLISNTEQYNTFAGAVNGAYRAKKPMQYASASIQSDLDFSLSAPTVISWLSGRIHGNGHKITLGSANFTSNIATTVGEDGIIEYLDVVFPSTGFYPVVYSNLGRIVGCNITRGIPAGSSAGLVSDCAGELPSSKGLFGRHTRCLIKILTINGAENYRLYNSNVAYNVEASYTAIPLEKGVSGELAYQLSHAADGQLCLWGQELGTDNDPRICFGQTPTSDTYVTRLTSYSVATPTGAVEYMNAGMALEAAPGYFKVCDDPESWTYRPTYNFIIDNGNGTYSAELINLDPTAAHFLPFEVEADNFSFRSVDDEGALVSRSFSNNDVVSLVFPIDMPVSNINGKVFLFNGYNATENRLEFVHSEGLTYISPNTPMIVVAKEGSILKNEIYTESNPLNVSSMTEAAVFMRNGLKHLSGYASTTIPSTDGVNYYRLSGAKLPSAGSASFKAPLRASGTLSAVKLDAGNTVSPFESYFAIPEATLSADAVNVALLDNSTTSTDIPLADVAADFPCQVWNLTGLHILTAGCADDLRALSPGLYIVVTPTKSYKLQIK